MNVGVVAYELEGAATGVGRYLEGLLTGAAAVAGDGWRFELFFKGEPFAHRLWDGRDPRFVAHFDGRAGARTVLWEQLRLPRLLRRRSPDVVFSPAYSLPPALTSPAVVTLHDLSFERLGDEFSPRQRWRRRLLARRAARRAAIVLADTRRAACEIAEEYGVPSQRLAVVPLAVDERFTAGRDEAEDRKRLAAAGFELPYLLYVGTILPRRRLDLVIAAFSDVAAERTGTRLVLAGDNRLRRPAELDEWIAASGVGRRIQVAGYVDEALLPAIYRQAEASFYLSRYEGFGLPPLEALSAGTPAITSPGLALDEIWPDYPYRAEALDRDAVGAALRRVLAAQREERETVVAEGRKRVGQLTWENAAAAFLSALSGAAAR